MLPHHWCATSWATIKSEKKVCKVALRAPAGRSNGSKYDSVDKYTRPGNPCPKVPGIGDTVRVFNGGGPKSPVKYWKHADTSAATIFKRAKGSGDAGS